MKKRVVTSLVIAISIFGPSSIAYAEEVDTYTVAPDSVLEPIEDPREYPNIDILPPPSEELMLQDPWKNSSIDPEPNNPHIDPTSQDEPETWAIVDENGNTLNVISCDIDFCGSGWIPTAYDGFTPTQWARVVLQGARDPETGQSNGGHYGQYNFPTNIWTREDDDASLWQVPIEYNQDPFCILNCPVEEPEQNVGQPVEEVLNDPIDAPAADQESTNTIESQTRSLSIKAILKESTFELKHRVNERRLIKNKKVWVIANKGKEKRVWKFEVDKRGIANIILPMQYITWDISINYKLKNNKKISNRVTLKN